MSRGIPLWIRGDGEPGGAGQVLVETALAAVGLVVMAFLVVRIGLWLNQTLVDRNTAFQQTRIAAASSNPGQQFALTTPDIHLIGPSAERAGGVGEQGPLQSATPPTCTNAGAALLADAQATRTEIAALQNADALRQQQVKNESNKAADLITATGTSGKFCTGDQCKSANWYLDMAQWLETVLGGKTVADWQAIAAQAQADIANAQAQIANCPPCTTDAKGKPDCRAHDFCVGAWTAVALAAQKLLDQANSVLNTVNQICAQTGTGNPWLGGAPACDPGALRAYAGQLNALAQTVADAVRPLVTTLENDAKQLQALYLKAEDDERQGRAQCASGRDP